MPIEKTVLPNGVRILSEMVSHVESASIGLWCRTGSSDETDAEAGITHFIEHMLFKGTPTRDAHQIADSIEARGGMLNAFTDKQATCYYCRVLADDSENGVDVLSDMMCHSLLDPVELAKEKGVVLEEIKRSEDEPGDHVHELHLHTRWGNHPLGRPIIGTAESVSSFQPDDLRAYMNRRYRGHHVLLAAAGKVNHNDLVAWAAERLGTLPVGDEVTPLDRPAGKAINRAEAKDVEQIHFCIGSDAPGLMDDNERYASSLMDHILGGGMASRLFQEIREKRGLAYSVGSYALNYTAGGAFTVYGGTSPATWLEVQDLVRKEFDKFMADGPTADELFKAKRSLCGSLVLGLEGMSSRMMRMAKNELIRERDVPIQETMDKINAVTLNQVTELARRVLDPGLVSTTAIGPIPA
jgi:predicted Zn-dependent peptidase